MRKNHFIISLYIISILLIPFIFCSCSNKNSNKRIKLNEVTRSIFYCPQYVAIELGYFNEENISLELTTSNGSDKTMTSLLSSQSDIALLGPETAIYVYNQGRTDFPIIFAQLTKKDGSFIVGHNNKSFSWYDLKGKKILSSRKGSLPEMTLNYVLKNHGISTIYDVNIITNIQMDLISTVFTKSMSDYACIFEPTTSILNKQNKAVILKAMADETDEIPYTCYCCRKDYIKMYPEIIQSFTNAIYKAQLFIKSSSAEKLADIVEKYFPDTNRNVLISSIQNYLNLDVWPISPNISTSSFETLKKIIKNSGQLSSDVEFEKIVDDSFAKHSIQNIT